MSANGRKRLPKYIRLLRQHVARGRRENALSSTYRYLDRSSYWRSECERLKDDLHAAHAKNVELQREIALLKEKASPSKQAAPKKRKQPDASIIPVIRSPKKARLDPVSAKSILELTDASDGVDLAGFGFNGTTLLLSVYDIHLHFMSRDKTEPELLAYQLTKAADALGQLITELTKRPAESSEADPTLRSVLVAATRLCKCLTAGLNRFSNVCHCTELQGQVIFAFVQMYQRLLECLAVVAKADVPDAGGAGNQQKSRSKKAQLSKGDALLDLTTRLLCMLTAELHATIEVHTAVLEGFMFVVLERLGSLLYLTTFGHPRGSTVEAEIMASTNLDHAAENSQARSVAEEIKAARLEAPYLIFLLNGVMTVAPATFGGVISSKTGKPKQANNKSSMKGALTIAAKERLQRTLVHCIFGGEEGADRDPFRDILKMPAVPDQPLPVPKLKDADVREWFKEEVWRLLGWEVLSSERDF